ncbi:MAG: glutathione S-transferase family protein [Candidatus Competibacteraceae bacterium]|nr:glutathione S-transferase family protein [Candidatus Competibacteraceae bacterium]
MPDDPVKSNEILLYVDATDPYSAKVNCWLDYKGLEFSIIHVSPLSRRQIGFTAQSTLPVLRIGDEWRVDSTQIGLWLEERFPDRPLLGRTRTQREIILQLNQWVDTRLVTALLERYGRNESFFDKVRNGWRLSAVLNRARSFSPLVRMIWPIILHRRVNNNASVAAAQQTLQETDLQVCREWLERLGQGPFLGELSEPSLADLGTFPQWLLPYRLGLHWHHTFLEFPAILNWMQRVQATLPANPLLVSEDFLVRPFPGEEKSVNGKR